MQMYIVGILFNEDCYIQNLLPIISLQLRHCRGQEGKIQELEGALSQVQGTADKREAVEKKLRDKLTDQLNKLRAQQVMILA